MSTFFCGHDGLGRVSIGVGATRVLFQAFNSPAAPAEPRGPAVTAPRRRDGCMLPSAFGAAQCTNGGVHWALPLPWRFANGPSGFPSPSLPQRVSGAIPPHICSNRATATRENAACHGPDIAPGSGHRREGGGYNLHGSRYDGDHLGRDRIARTRLLPLSLNALTQRHVTVPRLLTSRHQKHTSSHNPPSSFPYPNLVGPRTLTNPPLYNDVPVCISIKVNPSASADPIDRFSTHYLNISTAACASSLPRPRDLRPARQQHRIH